MAFREVKAVLENISISIAALEKAERLKEILKEKQWSPELGFEILLAYGLAYIHLKKRLASCQDREKELNEIIKEQVLNDGAYASLRFKNFQLAKDNKLVNFKLLGYSFDNEQLKATIESIAKGDACE